jgi:hemerythrin-like domain-containing protein
LRSPSAGWENPFDMLRACHEKVQRMLRLLLRLQSYLRTQGNDAQAQQAAVDCMRYFDLAAPLHHQDEELHVFPMTAVAEDKSVRDASAQLIAQHRAMESAWSTLRSDLLILVQAEPPSTGFSNLNEGSVAAFVALYKQHIAIEEDLIYPYVELQASPQDILHMGREMAARRGAEVASNSPLP